MAYNNNKNQNQKIYDDILAKMDKIEPIKAKILSKVFSMTYINVFRKFYKKNNRNLNIDGNNFTLKKVETFEDLLKKVGDDTQYKERIIEVVEKNYILYFKIKKKQKKKGNIEVM